MIYIFDKKQTIIKVLTNEDLTAGHLDLKINTATTFEFSLPANKPLPSNAKYVAVPHPLNGKKFILLRLTERTDNADTIDYSAYELAYQELATDGYIADKRPANQDALTLMKIALNWSNWELNNVNVAGTASTNFYYIDHLTAISKVVELLGGEIVFYVEIQGNTISGRYMDYLARQGEDTSKVFANGSNLLTIERQSDTSGVYTAILPRGKGVQVDGKNDASTPDGYGRRLNIADAVWKKSSGKPLDKPAGEIILRDPTANAEWGHINGNYRLLLETYDDIDDVNTLINSAYKTLQAVNHPKIQYSATIAEVGGLSLGDTVLIMHGERDLSYKTRVFEVDYDLLDPAQTQISLGDDLSSNSITSQINSVSSSQSIASEQTQWTINQVGRDSVTFGTEYPENPKVGDTFFKYLPNGDTVIYEWNGEIWEEKASTHTGADISAAIDDAIDKANKYTDELNEKQASEAAAFQSEANVALSSAAAERADMFKQSTSMATSAATHADSMADSAAAYGKAQAASALSDANVALGTAKSGLINDISKAKSDAIEAAKTADGVVKKQITDTETSLGVTISQNKLEADDKISTAQTDATAALDGLKSTVSKTEYNQKTGQLDKAVGSAALTADSAAASIKSYSVTTDGKLNSQAADILATSKAVTTKVSQADFNAKTGDLQTKYGQVKITADKATADIADYKKTNDGKVATNTVNITAMSKQIGLRVMQTDFDKRTQSVDSKFAAQTIENNKINQTVSELQDKTNAQGQINQLVNTEFSPDLEGWQASSDDDKYNPYRGAVDKNAGAMTLGFNTLGAATNTYATFKQDVFIKSNGDNFISLSWQAWTPVFANYANLWVRFYDSDNKLLTEQAKQWTEKKSDGSIVSGLWARQKWEGISIPQNTNYVSIFFQVREGIQAYLVRPMLVFGNTIGDYAQGNYNNNARVAELELGIDHITGLVNDPKKGLSATWNLASNGQTVAIEAKTNANKAQTAADTANGNAGKAQTAANTANSKADAIDKRVTTVTTTANGTQTTVQAMSGDITKLQAQQTITAGQVTTEVQDRIDGDNASEKVLKELIEQRVQSVTTGYQGAIQTMADGVIASVSRPNQLFNTDFSPDLAGWNVVNNGANGNNYNFYRSYLYDGRTVIGVDVKDDAGTNNNPFTAYFEQDVAVPGTNSGTTFSLSLISRTLKNLNNNLLVFSFRDADKQPISNDVINYWNNVDDGQWHDKAFENIAVPNNAKYIRVSFRAREGTTAYLSKPMFTFTANVQHYMPGSYSDMNTLTVLELLKDDWAIGITDNIGKITSGIIGDNNSMALINKNIILQGNTTVTGDFYAKGGNFKNLNASNLTTGILNAAAVRLINLDASSITTGNLNAVKVKVVGKNSQLDLSGDGVQLVSNDNTWLTGINQEGIGFILNSNGDNETLGGIYTTYSNRNNNINGFGLYTKSKQDLGPGYGGDEITIGNFDSNGTKHDYMIYNASKQYHFSGFHFYDDVDITDESRLIFRHSGLVGQDKQDTGYIRNSGNNTLDIGTYRGPIRVLPIGGRFWINKTSLDNANNWYAGNQGSWYFRHFDGTIAGIHVSSVAQDSSAELKKNIQLADTDKLSRDIYNMDVTTWNYKSETSNDRAHIGAVIGKEYNLNPSFLHSDNDAVNVTNIVFALVGTVQKQAQQISEMMAELSAIKIKQGEIR